MPLKTRRVEELMHVKSVEAQSPLVGVVCQHICHLRRLPMVQNYDICQRSGSTLKEYLDRTADMSPEERGQELEMDENLCCVHEEVAKEGQTEAPEADEVTNLHFITFVAVDEQLYELDARKNYPINHGSTSMDTLIKDAVAVCKKFMERDPENVNFSIMAFVAGASAETEEEEVEE
ncbi:ubiquitin carboxyl-terminal hydrolase isozyme L3 [Trichonephila clavipes]|nr:ubiquitin carboxyl-terminal hydrolase isozyme L3 [Trichonephila clavipes]